MGRDLKAEAVAAIALVPTAPQGALAAALSVLAEDDAPLEARVIAERAAGLAERDVGRPLVAGPHLATAIALAGPAGLTAEEALARISLAGVLFRVGDLSGALVEANHAARIAEGAEAATARSQRGLILQVLGEHDRALRDYRTALPALRRFGDRRAEAQLLTNRGLLHKNRGDLTAAEADLRRALAIDTELGATLRAAEVLHNLGIVAARRGDLPGALANYDEATRIFEELGVPRAETLLDRSEVLLAAQLLPEARRSVEAAIRGFEASGRAGDLAEARLALAQVALLERDSSTAAEMARAARVEFERERRRSWAVLARFAELQASWQAGSPPDQVAVEARATADLLAEAGWAVQALESRIGAARASLEVGNLQEAEAALAAASAAHRRGPAALRVRAWHAEALLRLARGNRRSALVAVGAGLRVAEEHRSTLGATELRARAATTGADLADLGVSLALDSRRPASVLAWSERWRARALQSPPVRPPTDRELTTLLARLRDVASKLEQARLEGADIAHTRELERRQANLEGEIRRRSHAVGAPAGGSMPTIPSIAELRSALAGRCLVELVSHAGHLSAVTVNERATRLFSLGSLDDVVRERESLLFALRRLSRHRSSEASADAAAASLYESARRLDASLVSPISRELGDRSLVIVPAGDLHILPWSLLPSLRGRSVTVSPSASLWHARARGPEQAKRIHNGQKPRAAAVLVAGPGVPEGNVEVEQLRSRYYPTATVYAGADATATAVTAALAGATMAHVAAHGQFRADNALFSSLQMADGPLTVYDLEGLKTTPACIVLSACEAGLSDMYPGGEPLGPPAALLSLGTQSLVASVSPVPDRGAATFMLSLHRRMSVGIRPAEALAAAQAEALDGGIRGAAVSSGEPEALAATAAASFVCFGAG